MLILIGDKSKGELKKTMNKLKMCVVGETSCTADIFTEVEWRLISPALLVQ